MVCKSIYKTVKSFFQNIDKYCCEKYVNTKNRFVRKRIMTLEDIMIYILVQNGRSNALEGRDFIKEKLKIDSITPQAIGKQRKYLDPKVYSDMSNDLIDEIYKNTGCLPKFKGYRLMACDGSEITLPNRESTKKEFKVFKNKPSTPYLSRCRASCIVDSLTQLILDVNLVDKTVSEVDLAIEHLKNLNQRHDMGKSIMIFDRGYNSLELMLQAIKAETHFVIRLRKDTFKNERKRQTEKDQILQIATNARRLENVKDPEIREMMKNTPYIKLRVTEIELDNNTKEYLVSNLPIDKFSIEDLKEIYNKRWKIETTFDFLKNVVNVENFTGIRKIIIEQDFYSEILLYNTSMALKFGTETLSRKKKRLKPNQALNFNLTLGIVDHEFYNLITSKKSQITKILKELYDFIKKQKITIKKHKRSETTPKNPDKSSKYPLSKRKART